MSHPKTFKMGKTDRPENMNTVLKNKKQKLIPKCLGKTKQPPSDNDDGTDSLNDEFRNLSTATFGRIKRCKHSELPNVANQGDNIDPSESPTPDSEDETPYFQATVETVLDFLRDRYPNNTFDSDALTTYVSQSLVSERAPHQGCDYYS